MARIRFDERVARTVRLAVALHLARPARRLEAAEQRVVAALGVEVVGDRRTAACRCSGTRRPAACGCSSNTALVGSMRPGLNVRCAPGHRLGRRSSPCRPAGRRTQAAVGAEQEADADVAARLAAVLVRGRVDLAVLVGRPAGRLDRREQAREGDVRGRRRGAVAAPSLSWISSRLRMSGARRLFTIWAATPVVAVLRVEAVEVLDVVAAIASSSRFFGSRDLALELAVGERRVVEREVLEVAERVVDDRAHRGGEAVADVGEREERPSGSPASSRMNRSGLKSPRRYSCGALRSKARTRIGPRGARTLAPGAARRRAPGSPC